MDIFIPIDTNKLNPYFLMVNSYLTNFVYKYVDNKRKIIKGDYPDFNTFNKNFNISDAIIEDLISFTETKGIERNQSVTNKFKKDFKLRIKAEIADQVYSQKDFYRILFSQDEMVLRAVKEIKRGADLDKPSAMNGGEN